MDNDRNTVHSRAYGAALHRVNGLGWHGNDFPKQGAGEMPDFYLPHARHKDSRNGADWGKKVNGAYAPEIL